MSQFLLGLVFLVSGSAAVIPQEEPGRILERRFHRVHLRNGNFIDGHVLELAEDHVLLRVKVDKDKTGEMAIRNDLIALDRDGSPRVEIMKLRSRGEEGGGRDDDDPAIAERIIAETKRLVLELERAFEEERVPIVQEIIRLGEHAALYLTSVYRTLSPDIRSEVDEVLIEAKATKALPIYLEWLEDEDPRLRTLAVRILSAMGDRALAKHVRPLLDDPVARVRTAAIRGLEKLLDRSAFYEIGHLLRDPDREVRSQSLRSLRAISRRNGMEDKLFRLLMSSLSLARGEGRADLVFAIAGLGRKEAWEDLVRFLHDPHREVRGAVVIAIMKLKAPEAGEEILARIPLETDPLVRRRIADAVRQFRLVEAVEGLIDWLLDEDEQVRKATVVALTYLTRQGFAGDYEKWAAWWDNSR